MARARSLRSPVPRYRPRRSLPGASPGNRRAGTRPLVAAVPWGTRFAVPGARGRAACQLAFRHSGCVRGVERPPLGTGRRNLLGPVSLAAVDVSAADRARGAAFESIALGVGDGDVSDAQGDRFK